MNELSVPQGGALVVPGRGFEGMKIDRSDLIIPRAKLLQPLSPEIVESKVDGAKSGQIRNSLTLDLLPSRFVPIFCFKSWFRFNPRNRSDAGFDPAYEAGAMIWRSTDPDDPKVQEETKFGPNGEKPLALTCLNFFSLFPGVQMPLVVSFAKTSYKAGKQLLSLARFCGGDMWSRAYQLGSALQTNDKGTYHIFTVTTLGHAEASEQAQAEAWWRTFSDKAQELKVHEEGQEEDGETREAGEVTV